MRGDQLGLRGLIFRRHLLGVAAGGLGLTELVVLDRDEFRAERFDLFLRRRPHIGRRDDRAVPPGGGDGLQSGDADAHHKNFGGGNGSRRRHHHRNGSAIFGRRVYDRAIARDIGLGGQDVHHLGAGDAGHELHGESDDPRRRELLELLFMSEGIRDGDHRRAAGRSCDLAR